jgi:Asp/Glu/hydantoin racemase
MRISFLHTLDGNRNIFDSAAKDLGLSGEQLRHEIRTDLRLSVQQTGAATAEVAEQIRRCLMELSTDADAVVVTCATLSPVVAVFDDLPIPIVRADAALVAAAARIGGHIVVLCALDSSVEPTRHLFEQYVNEKTESVKVVNVVGIWDLFSSGNLGACLAEIARAADQAYDTGASVVAFAHPWMAQAAPLVRAGHVVLDSPHAALQVIANEHAAG